MTKKTRVVGRLGGSAITRPRCRVGVVGAGLAGLSAARLLAGAGHEVTVLEKARGAGGRMSTRRDGEWRFDHGAQYFTARDPHFLQQVQDWERRGLVCRWQARIAALSADSAQAKGDGTDRYVGLPGMNAPCRDLAAGLDDCRYGWALQSAVLGDRGWLLESTGGATLECDALVVTAPPEQQRQLLRRADVDAALEGVRMLPCWALMLVLDKPLFESWDGVFVNQGPLSWIASQAARPGRPAAQAWLLHAGADWSAQHLEDDPAQVVKELLAAARALPGAGRFTVEHAVAHRWRYALAEAPLEAGALCFPEARLALAGDWCAGSRVEGAWLSGVAAAGRLGNAL